MEKIDDCLAEIQYIGLRIAYFRKLRNLTQADLADRLHINKNYLSHIESRHVHDSEASIALL